MQLTFSFRNAELVSRGFQNLEGEVKKIGKLPIYRTMQAILRQMKEYPSRVSTYIRTFRFRNNWAIVEAMYGYRIQNRTDYGAYVVGDAFGNNQAWMHEGVWRLFRDVSDEEAEKLPEEVQEELTLAVRRAGLS